MLIVLKEDDHYLIGGHYIDFTQNRITNKACELDPENICVRKIKNIVAVTGPSTFLLDILEQSELIKEQMDLKYIQTVICPYLVSACEFFGLLNPKGFMPYPVMFITEENKAFILEAVQTAIEVKDFEVLGDLNSKKSIYSQNLFYKDLAPRDRMLKMLKNYHTYFKNDSCFCIYNTKDNQLEEVNQ